MHRSDFLYLLPGFRGSAIFSTENKKKSKLRPNILNIPSNFIFWFDTTKGHIQTKSAFPKNENLNHNLCRQFCDINPYSNLWASNPIENCTQKVENFSEKTPFFEKVSEKNPNFCDKNYSQSFGKSSDLFNIFIECLSEQPTQSVLWNQMVSHRRVFPYVASQLKGTNKRFRD